MQEPVVMTPESTIKELEFALETGMDFTKHDVAELLNEIEVQDICNKLGLKANLRAVCVQKHDAYSCDRAYYVLSFGKKDKQCDFATYFGKDLVSSSNDYDLEPEEEDDD